MHLATPTAGFPIYCAVNVTTTWNSLRAAAGLAVLAALAIGGIVGCSSTGNSEVIVSSDSPDSVESPTPQVATPEGVAQPPEPTVAPVVTPTESPETSGLVWTEVDIADALGADEHSTIRLESVGDGRVLAMSFVDRGIVKILVSEDSTEWSPIPVPAGFLPWTVDIIGERWMIQGWDTTIEDPTAQILFSDDRGANWTELKVDLGPLDGTAWIADAILAGELIVVVVLNDSVSPDVEAFSEDDMGNEPSMSSVLLFLSDGGPAEWITEYPGWFTFGYGASDGFHLIMSGPDGISMVESLDGRQWTSTVVDYEVIDSGPDTIWTTDQTGQEFMVERFDGVYGPGQMLTKPDGISWIVRLSVGPAGVAAVGGPEAPKAYSDDDLGLPDVSVEKDGFELRYNQPEGGITLWDLKEDSAVYVFEAEALERETPPEGVREVQEDDGTQLVVFEDPETGDDLVAFNFMELAEATAAANDIKPTFDWRSLSVGWSLDGTDWEWQSLQEAFGLPEHSERDDSFTEVQLAVGRDFVLAQVQTFEFPEAEFDEDLEVGVGAGQSDSTSAYLSAPISPPPPRWFIAKVD